MSIEGAERDYGMVIVPGGEGGEPSVDAARTAALRSGGHHPPPGADRVG